MDGKNILNIILSVIIIVLLVKNCNSGESETKWREKYTLQNQLLTDSITRYKDKEGRNITKINSLETSNVKNILELKSSKESVIKLQSIIKSYKPETVVVIEERVKLDTIYNTDTSIVYVDSNGVKQIEFPISLKNEWVKVTGKVNSSITSLSVSVENKYSVFFKKNKKTKQTEVYVTNENPYSITKELLATNTNTLKEKTKRIGLGIQLGYGLGLTNLQPIPFIGIGISYNFLNF